MSDDVPHEFQPSFTRGLGYLTRIRILGVVMDADEPLSVSDIIRQADISRGTFYDHCDRLVDLNLLESEKRGNAVEYELADNDLAEALFTVHEGLDEQFGKQDLQTLASEIHK